MVCVFWNSLGIAKNLSQAFVLAVVPALLLGFHLLIWLISFVENPVMCDWFVKPSAVVAWLVLVLHLNTYPSIYSAAIDEPFIIVLNILLGQDSKYTRNTFILWWLWVLARSGRSYNVCPFPSRGVAVSFILRAPSRQGGELFVISHGSKRNSLDWVYRNPTCCRCSQNTGLHSTLYLWCPFPGWQIADNTLLSLFS